MNETKFNFDWDASEDTSKDTNPVYASLHVVQLFGRGTIGGIDIRQQKENQELYNRLVQMRQTAEDAEFSKAKVEKDRSIERKVASDERQWSKKPLHEMRRRDWCIFKEDFSISTDGGNIPNPIRDWREIDGVGKHRVRIAHAHPAARDPYWPAEPRYCEDRRNEEWENGDVRDSDTCVHPATPTEDIKDLGPYARILAPTRELASQIESETVKFAEPMGFACVAFIGGHTMELQAFNLRNWAHIVIA